jgi:hypothetical protein
MLASLDGKVACELSKHLYGVDQWWVLLKKKTKTLIMSLSEFLSKIGTHLLPSFDIIEKNRNPLACLRNAGSHSAMTYCTVVPVY